MTPDDQRELVRKLKDAAAMLNQAAAQIEAGEPREVWGESFADGSAAFFYCRLILGFK